MGGHWRLEGMMIWVILVERVALCFQVGCGDGVGCFLLGFGRTWWGCVLGGSVGLGARTSLGLLRYFLIGKCTYDAFLNFRIGQDIVLENGYGFFSTSELLIDCEVL